jgi:hypothetical protein
VACPCVITHVPKPAYLQKHHILPLGWGGPTTAANLVEICGTTHDAAHHAMNKMVKAKAYVDLSGYPRYARMLALRAVDEYLALHDGQWPHVYTLSHPGSEHA